MKNTHEELQKSFRAMSWSILIFPLIVFTLSIYPMIDAYNNPSPYKRKLVHKISIKSETGLVDDANFYEVLNIGKDKVTKYSSISNAWFIVALPSTYYLIQIILIISVVWQIRRIVFLAEHRNWFNLKNGKYYKYALNLWLTIMGLYFLYSNLNSLFIKSVTGESFKVAELDFNFLFIMLTMSITGFMLRIALRANSQGIDLKEENDLTI